MAGQRGASTDTAVVFDAMGVLFAEGDDVGEILVPYIRDLGCELARATIDSLYMRASLGQLTSQEFWVACGVEGDDHAYCRAHHLSPGIDELLGSLASQGRRLAVLTNDVAEWSLILRRRFHLEHVLPTWIVSGEVGVRKPSPEIYWRLVEALGIDEGDIHFFDDRPTNVEAARRVGFRSHRYEGPGQVLRVLGMA